MKKVFIFFGLCIAYVCFFSITSYAAPELCSGAKSAVLIESTTGEVLFDKEKDLQRAPASMTKIMTLLLIYDALESGKIKKEDMVTGSEFAKSMGGTQIYLEVGEKISVDEMLKCICIASANDCAVAMAEHVWGSEAKFVEKMNQRAKDLGCQNTNFLDSTGLTDEGHYTSSYDMALISRELVNKYPDVLNYSSIKEDYIRQDTSSPFWLVNTNKILGHVTGLRGLKTGHTSYAKYCITLVMEQNDMTLISVVMGYDTATTRNAESVGLLKYGFANNERVKVVEKGEEFSTFHSVFYKPAENYIVSASDLYILQDKNNPIDYEIDFKYEVTKENYEGVVGKVTVYDESGKVIVEGDLVLEESATRNNIFQVFFAILKKIFS